MSQRGVNLAFGFFLALGITIFAALSLTLYHYPLFPLQTDRLDWSVAWLGMTVIDYYGAAVCLCAIIMATERMVPAVTWCVLCLLFGSPFCCAYMLHRLAWSRDLALRSPSQDPMKATLTK
mmetsp:Transcript_12481/g.33400  ORF Transcript_12481/g.33400 Transcript_12481/m.33400 type:complete len:121 (+) Transcript_12481:36-398(+)|eukprot:CAMPEP_0185183554 /NCGR_PEP_ID=MMETSP1140-20130426/2057_1 /TAXON_ID=298111 /ORGANISM="Pavlova sp., Strain CCMP459" /LENGTH=120 /DNA_ID=CAMNT_0027749575 /DNA_START=25 /DNA_END=387 /DNA_ORIENTATION=+